MDYFHGLKYWFGPWLSRNCCQFTKSRGKVLNYSTFFSLKSIFGDETKLSFQQKLRSLFYLCHLTKVNHESL